MNKRILLLVLLGILITGCKSKKAYSDNLRTQNVLSERKKKKSNTKTTATMDTFLPKDSGEFITFEIESIPEYIDTFSEIAQLEMKAYGIPASITLAQGLLESGYGKGELALKTNNHFGIKCHKGGKVITIFMTMMKRGNVLENITIPCIPFAIIVLF